ncbi:MAG: FG-GAP repeat domain-containing protein [Planctomycetota bacterium]
MDWDSDGKKDLLNGGADGYIHIYLNTGTDADPVFTSYTFLMLDGIEYNCSHFATPYITDWNNDGKKDLICGNLEGKVHLLINEGTNSSPYFKEACYIQDGDNDLQSGIRNTPVVADWNRDGKKDLLVGAYHGLIEYYENQGIDEDPVFDGHAYLEVDSGQLLSVGSYSRLAVADWDEDGEIDILCGNSGGYIHYFHAIGPLSVDVNTLSASNGGSIQFFLDPGPDYSERNYFLIGTEAGTEPGTPLPGGATLPLNIGILSWFILYNYNTPPFINFRGILDRSGKAAASLNLPFMPLPTGTILDFAFTTEMPYDYQSKPLSVEIVP